MGSLKNQIYQSRLQRIHQRTSYKIHEIWNNTIVQNHFPNPFKLFVELIINFITRSNNGEIKFHLILNIICLKCFSFIKHDVLFSTLIEEIISSRKFVHFISLSRLKYLHVAVFISIFQGKLHHCHSIKEKSKYVYDII